MMPSWEIVREIGPVIDSTERTKASRSSEPSAT